MSRWLRNAVIMSSILYFKEIPHFLTQIAFQTIATPTMTPPLISYIISSRKYATHTHNISN